MSATSWYRMPRAEVRTSHTEKSLVATFGPREGHKLWRRFTVHYTPKHGSWLNAAEIEAGLVTRECLGTRRIGDLATLRREVTACRTVPVLPVLPGSRPRAASLPRRQALITAALTGKLDVTKPAAVDAKLTDLETGA